MASLSRTVNRSVNVAAETLSTATVDQNLSAMTAELSDLSVVQDDFTVVARGDASDPKTEILRHLNEIAYLIGQIMPLSLETEPEFAHIFAEKDSGRLGNLVAGRAPSETFQITIEQTAITASALREQLASGHLYRETLRLINAAFERVAQAIE